MPENNEIRSFLLKELPHHSRDIVTFAATQLNMTRMTIYRHLQKLVQQNQVIQTGEKRGVEYFLKAGAMPAGASAVSKAVLGRPPAALR